MALIRFEACRLPFVGLSTFLLLLIAATASAQNSMEDRFAALAGLQQGQVGQTDAEKARVFTREYQRLFRSGAGELQLADLDAAELDFLFRAADMAAFYSGAAGHVADMTVVLDAMASRRVAADRHYVAMHDAFVGSRMLDQARSLSVQHPVPGLQDLPDFSGPASVPPGTRTAWTVGGDRRELAREEAGPARDAHVVVVAHPLCRYSRNAVAAILEDPTLAAVFKKYASWMTPQDRYLHFDRMQRWNREYPEAPVRMVYQRAEWPEIDSWSTPTFYFFAHGQLVAKISGWPEEGRVVELLDASRRAGLVD